MQNLDKCKWILCCVFVLNSLPPVKSRVLRLTIDEELKPGTKIGSLLDHVPGSFNNLNFVRLTNADDASHLFTVDQYSGDLIVAARVDREELCSFTIAGTIEENSKSSTSYAANTDFLNPCELRFSVNCLSAHTASTLGPVGGKVIELFDIVITLRDVNDNGCTFLPTDTQVLKLREDAPVGQTRVILHSPFDPDETRNGHSLNLGSIRYAPAADSFTSKYLSESLHETEFYQMFRLHSRRAVTPRKSTNDDQDTISETNRILLELELIQPLDYELKTNYTFALIANDGLGQKDHQCVLQVLILVEDCNDNVPQFQQRQYVVNLTENTPIGTLVVQLNATDVDSGDHGAIVYSLISPASSSEAISHFYVHPTKGELRLQKRLNYRQRAKHKLAIQASNVPNTTIPRSISSASKSGQTAFVEINVIDVNDQAPKIRFFSPTGSAQLEVVEESPPGQDVVILDVTDRDAGRNAEVECQLVNQTVLGALNLHHLDGPSELFEKDYTKKRYKLTVTKSLDREQLSTVGFTIRCWDYGVPKQTSEATGVLNVVDINDHAPEFDKHLYFVSVVEDSDPLRMKNAFQLLQITAVDKDAGPNAEVRYRLDHETSSSTLNLITIDPSTGILSSTGTLDREMLESLSITVLATDQGDPPRSARAKINIRITDYNDNAPNFSKPYYTFKLRENSPIGQLIGTVQVTDADAEHNARLTVQLEDGPEAVEIFTNPFWTANGHNSISKLSSQPSGIRPIFDEIPLLPGKVKRPIDIPRIRVVIQKTKQPTRECSSNCSVYEIQLYADSIWDREALLVNRIRNPVRPESGQLPHTNNNIDRTNQTHNDPYLVVYLRAEDQGEPKLIKRVQIRIRVLDENDNSPTFLFPDPNAVNVTRVTVSRKEQKDYVFAHIYAFDDDSGSNGTVNYFIQSGNPNGYFHLEQQTGALKMNKMGLPSYAIGEHMLNLEARDGGQPAKSTATRLIIDVDDSDPKGLVGRDLAAAHLSGLFDSGAAGHTFNLYILVAIVVASAVVSALLLFSIFFLLRRSRRARSCRHVAGCANGTRMTKSNSNDLITEKYNAVQWSTPCATLDGQRQLYNDLNYRTYSPLIDGSNVLDFAEPNGTFLPDANGLTLEKRSATLINPHLYSVGKFIHYDTFKPSNLELYLPPEQSITSAQYMTGEPVTFYRSVTCHDQQKVPETDVTLSGHVFVPAVSNYVGATNDTQSMQPGLEGGMICFAEQKNMAYSAPHQQFCYLAPVNSQWSTAPATAPTPPVVNMESNSLRSADCDSGNGDSLDIKPSLCMTLMARNPNSLSEKQTYMNC